MERVLLILAAMTTAAPAWADFGVCFPVVGAGSFDTYPRDLGGYGNGGSDPAPRLGFYKVGLGWMAWDAKDANGVEHFSWDDSGSGSLAQFLWPGGSPGMLYLNLDTNNLVGSWAIETLRCGNTGVIQADGSVRVGYIYDNPAPNITGSTQPWAWKAGAGPWSAPGKLNVDDELWIRPDGGGPIYWQPGGVGPEYGFDSGTATWAIQSLLGFSSSQAGTNMAAATAAGQIVSNDGAGNAVFLSQANYIGSTSPRRASGTGNWYAVRLSPDLLESLAFDPQTKGLVFNNWFAGTTPSGAQFYGPSQNNAANAYIFFVPEPATLVLLALGGIALLRRVRNGGPR